MRIRRRPQPAQQPGSDPTMSTTAPPTPQRNAARGRGWLGAAGGGGGEDREAKPLRAGADLGHKPGVARRLALPQDGGGNAAADRGGSMGGAQQHGAAAGADDGGRRRFGAVSNGHRNLDKKDGVACVGGDAEPVVAAKAEERGASNGGLQLALVPVPAVAVAGGGGAKKRRGPAVLLEGSRCSRVNGRGWRCSQPTLVGYSLCEHHLGKGRMRSAAAAAAAARGRLGRTEHHGAARAAVVVPAAAGAASMVTIAAAPPPSRAEAPPSLPPPC